MAGLLDAGYKMQDAGCRMLDVGCRILDGRIWKWDTGYE